MRREERAPKGIKNDMKLDQMVELWKNRQGWCLWVGFI